MGKILKSLLRILCVTLVIVLVRAGLTKFGLIPNRFDVECLRSDKKCNLRLPVQFQFGTDYDDFYNLFSNNKDNQWNKDRQWNKDKQCNARGGKLSDENDFLCDLGNGTYREFKKDSSRYDYIEIDENGEKTTYYCRGWFDGCSHSDIYSKCYPETAKCLSWMSDEQLKKAGFFHYYDGFLGEGFHAASFTVFKKADPNSNLKLNDVITYTVTIMNMGDYGLENGKIEDDLVDLSDKTFNLKLRERTSFTYTYTVTQEDVDRGSIFSVVTGSADVVGKDVRIKRTGTSRVSTISGVNTISRVNTITTGDIDRENIVNVVTGSANEVKGLNSEGDSFTIDENNDKDLSKTIESMGLKFSNCPNIFFQPLDDDENMGKYYWTEDHEYYYRDKENKKMVLMPNISYVGSSDCESYDKWFVEDGFKTRMDDLGIQIMEQHVCREYSPNRSICSSEVICKKIYYSSFTTRYKCCNQEGECVFTEDHAITIPDCSKGPC